MTDIIISVLTAVDSNRGEHLIQAYESLLQQRTSAGYTFEWVVQVDGDPNFILPFPLSDWINVASNFGKAGEAATRNLALGRSKGSWIVTLDADDLLLPDGLAIISQGLQMHSGIGWLATNHRLLSPDSVDIGGRPLDLGSRTFKPGELVSIWDEQTTLPLIPHCVTYARDILLAAGGWMALPRGADTGAMMAVASLHSGAAYDRVTHYYRRWPRQVTQEPWLNDGSITKAAGRALIRERCRILMASKL